MKKQKKNKMMGKVILCIMFTLCCILPITRCSAQAIGAAINNTGATADPCAMLDVSSSTQGVLITRVDLTSTTVAAPVNNPVNSLLVYNKNTAGDVTPGFYYWDVAKWVRIATGASSGSGLSAIKTLIYTNTNH